MTERFAPVPGLDGELVSGDLIVRLARTEDEVLASQHLRYRVFYEEMAARPSAEMAATRRDFDAYDGVCDHLLVIDQRHGDGPSGVVGTYRLIRRSAADQCGGFYTADEYDISALKSYSGEVLELGRSCVDDQHRTRPTMQILWRGIAAYVFHHHIEVMFGCASLPGTDPAALAEPLSYLHHHHLAPPDLRPRALEARYSRMDLMAVDQISAKAAFNSLPPLIKGYLRLGGFVGDGAVIDHQFNTTDVCVIVKTDLVTSKYYSHYSRTARDGSGEEAGA
ncbi:MAG: GNAT family N-acetyltransferase [Alphaproteobacteria bacterium]|nr:GNAT family N-acyltransferase [Alphaproteobacteria bacterium]TAD88659.1 MAG: GNAT family N-acetyltransferase [Alphaproteobacteria bacterium]